MILCVTPNPAIDRTLHVNSLHVGEVHRANKVLAAAGGKGLNVARTILALGGEPFCMGLAGGHTGNLLAELAARKGLPAHWTWIKNESRTCVILVERGRDATVINERGAKVNGDEWQAFLNDVWREAEHAQLICISGSLPPGFSIEFFQSLLSGLAERKKSVWVDTSGAALKVALQIQGVNIKVNAGELSEAVDVEISNTEQAAKAGLQLIQQGVGTVVVTLGKEGAVLVTNSGVWVARPPAIEMVSSVGSGDAFLGGLTVALEAGNLPEVALCYGVAAGAANCLHFGGGMVRREEFAKTLETVKVSFR